MRLTHALQVGICALSMVAGPIAQSPAPSGQGPPAFRTATRLVQVNVVAHDRDGRVVADLARGDFKLYEDGKEQPIELFSIESDRAAAPPAPSAATNTFSNRLEGRAGAAVTVILFDRLNTRFEDQAQARDQMVKFLGQIQRDDRVALYVLESATVRVLHDFTSDATSLLRALSRYRGQTSGELAASEEQVPDSARTGDAAEDAAMEAFLKAGTEMVAAEFTRRRVESTTSALEAIANHLAGVRGRKNLIWVSSGFPLVIVDERGNQQTASRDVSSATRAVNNANIAIYPVDARGLVGAFSSPLGARTPAFTTLTTVRANTDAMQTLADATGGRAFFNTNDIGGAVRRAVDDGRLTYVLGYYPSHGRWDGRFREIKVKVSRPGVDIRHRKGYLALPAQRNAASRKDALLDVLRSPLDATSIGLTAHIARIETQGLASDEVNVAIHVDPAAVTLEKVGDFWEGAFDLVIAQSASDGTFVKNLDTTVSLRLPADTRDQMIKEGLTVNRKIALRGGASRCQIVVRDVATGAIGSVIIPSDKLRGAAR